MEDPFPSGNSAGTDNGIAMHDAVSGGLFRKDVNGAVQEII